MNSSAQEVDALDRELGLDLLQFHGDESPAFIARFGARALPAVRWRDAEDARRVREHVRAWGVLVERRVSAFDGGALYGGTGEAWDYSEVAALAGEVRLLLAGGLGPENVRAAVAAVAPWGVDVCSRIESAPGLKDPQLMRRFFAEVG